jgi:HlyD family secretion protein
MKKKIIIASICLLVLIIGAAVAKKVATKKNKKEAKINVRIETVKSGEFIEIVNAPGEIRPKTKVDISAKISARIMELPFDEGQTVTAGDPDADPPVAPSLLIRLDSKNLESQLQSAIAHKDAQTARIEVEKAIILSRRSTLIGTKASLDQATVECQRQNKLLETSDISQSSYDQIKCRQDELQAQYDASTHSINSAELNIVVMHHNLKSAQASVDEAREALSYTTITSPIDGVITVINAEIGEVVMTGTMNNPGTVIMQVADLSEMILLAQIDETNVGQVQVGQTARIHVPAFWEEEFEGVVQNIALTHRMSNTGAKYYKTEILIKGDVKKLFSGLTADVDIETNRHKDIVKVPSQSVLARRLDEIPLDITEENLIIDKKKTNIPVVYRFIDGKAVVTPVKIGPSDLTHTLILEGVTENDIVVTGPYKILGSLKHNKSITEEKKDAKDKDKKDSSKKNENKGKK